MNIIVITGIIVAGIVAVIAILAHGKGCKTVALPIVKRPADAMPTGHVTINFKEPEDRQEAAFDKEADLEDFVDVLGDYAAILACPPARGLSRNSKLTYVRKDYHDRISRIVNILNVDGINISSYIDMVLTDHFKRYENQINYLNRNGYHDIC